MSCKGERGVQIKVKRMERGWEGGREREREREGGGGEGEGEGGREKEGGGR